MKDFQIVTVSTGRPHQSYFTYDQFFLSASPHDVLVLDQKFHPYTGLGSKPKMVFKAIKENLINAEHILFCDCFDMVFATDPRELFETYKAFKSPFVISSERNCFPADLKEQYDALPDAGKSSFRYLNSGMIVARTDAMLAVLDAMELHNVPEDYYDYQRGCNVHINDQELYQHIYLRQPVEMDLDYDQVLCNTLHSVSITDLDFSKDRIMNKETETYPCSFHLNGSAKTDGLREPILEHLKLPV